MVHSCPAQNTTNRLNPTCSTVIVQCETQHLIHINEALMATKWKRNEKQIQILKKAEFLYYVKILNVIETFEEKTNLEV